MKYSMDSLPCTIISLKKNYSMSFIPLGTYKLCIQDMILGGASQVRPGIMPGRGGSKFTSSYLLDLE